MFGFISGKVIANYQNKIIINVNNVGYEIIPSNITYKLNENVECYIFTHVSENNISLIGFKDIQSKILFEYLITINGVGPKVATLIISKFTISEIFSIFKNKKSDELSKVKGISKNLAEKIILNVITRKNLKEIYETISEYENIDIIPDKDNNVLIETKEIKEKKEQIKLALKKLGFDTKFINESLNKINYNETIENNILKILQNKGE